MAKRLIKEMIALGCAGLVVVGCGHGIAQNAKEDLNKEISLDADANLKDYILIEAKTEGDKYYLVVMADSYSNRDYSKVVKVRKNNTVRHTLKYELTKEEHDYISQYTNGSVMTKEVADFIEDLAKRSDPYEKTNEEVGTLDY